MSTSFSESFPVLLQSARELYDSFVLVSFVVVFAGFLLAVWRGIIGDIAEIMRAVLSVAVLVVVLGSFPSWIDQLQQITHEGVVEQIGANPSETHQRLAVLITDPIDKNAEVGFWDVLFSDEASLGKVILYLGVYALSKFAWGLMWLSFLIQHILLLLGIAVSPLFLSMFMLNATRGIAVRFILSLLGIVLWPLGWAVADLVTRSLLEASIDDEVFTLIQGNIVLYSSQSFVFLFVLSLWLIFSTLAAPWIFARAITTGSQIGVALLGGFSGASAVGFTSGIGSGAVASAGGASAAGAVGTGAAGGAAGFLSASTGGSGALASAGIGAVAVGAAGLSSASQGGGGSGSGQASTSGDSEGSAPPPNYDAIADQIASQRNN